MTEGLRAGAASVRLSPPPGLTLLGFVRHASTGTGEGLPLEASAMFVESDQGRVVLCGVDICGINRPDIDELVERVAGTLDMDPAGVLLNWSHTHLSVLGGYHGGYCAGPPQEPRDSRTDEFGQVVQDKIVQACREAMERAEPAEMVWGVGEADLAVNRRERADGDTILGWNPHELIDRQVTALQARRPDGTVIGTAVAYGCHPVATGWDCSLYSADFPGALRARVRDITGGECLFLQASGGNVLPRVAFTQDETAAIAMGRRLAIEAVHALADRYPAEPRAVKLDTRSVMPISLYRVEVPADEIVPVVAAVRRAVSFPLQPLPTLDEIRALREGYEAEYRSVADSGDSVLINSAYYQYGWALETEQAIAAGTAPTTFPGWIHAVRIGNGAIVTGPGETFTEIGMAIKERSPAIPTVYCGYTNGNVTYFATAAEYPFGGYEAGYGNRGFGLPAQVTDEAERILVETGVRLAEQLFPDADPWPAERGFVATGELPTLPGARLTHPSER